MSHTENISPGHSDGLSETPRQPLMTRAKLSTNWPMMRKREYTFCKVTAGFAEYLHDIGVRKSNSTLGKGWHKICGRLAKPSKDSAKQCVRLSSNPNHPPGKMLRSLNEWEGYPIQATDGISSNWD